MKQGLRKKAKETRKTLDCIRASEKICSQINNWEHFYSANNIMIYHPINNEINLLKLVKNNDKNFFLPVIKNNEIKVVYFDNKSLLINGLYDIKEPIGDELTDYSILDIIFVPALAANIDGYRIGYGKGYYDRFLNHISPVTKKVIPIYNELIFENIYPETHDQKVDYLITPDRIISALHVNLNR